MISKSTSLPAKSLSPMEMISNEVRENIYKERTKRVRAGIPISILTYSFAYRFWYTIFMAG